MVKRTTLIQLNPFLFQSFPKLFMMSRLPRCTNESQVRTISIFHVIAFIRMCIGIPSFFSEFLISFLNVCCNAVQLKTAGLVGFTRVLPLLGLFVEARSLFGVTCHLHLP